MRSGARLRSSDIILLAVAIVTLLLLVVTLVRSGSSGAGSAPQREPVGVRGVESSAPVVGFIGDSYVGGSAMGGVGEGNVTAILARRFNMRVLNVATGGTGYVASGSNGLPFEGGQLTRVVEARPRLVVVVGSRNDAGQDGVAGAASHLYESLKARLPGVRVVVVGPLWVDGSPPAALTTLRGEVRSAAEAAGAVFIDPIADGWFAGPASSLIGTDNVHPTDAGHQHMAQLLGDELVQLGFLSP